ncbi:MAG: phage integrase SAM-like domain-containing protein [Lutibacter sp.]|jgi:integrase
MSSIGKQTIETGIRFFIQLSPGENKQRPKIHLGQVTRKQAETAQTHMETLIASRKTGGVVATATQEWLANIPDILRERLEKLKLVEARGGKRWTVANWVANYIDKRPDVKKATKRKWRDVEKKLLAFFRFDCIGDITVQHAKNFRTYLQSTIGLSENSIRRQIGIARQFFNAAIEAELIAKNPFRGQSVSVRPNESRFFYVNSEMAQKVIAACPDTEWRLIFGLARFGGLRCPSEVLRLKWVDVDFANQRFTVHASKTEHHADMGIRTVPMFPELKPLFQDAFDNAKEGAVYCIERYRSGEVNLRTQLGRIVKQAGLETWPKLFQNLRSTRETELFKMTGGNVKAVCQWIGNTPAVAMIHYAQVTESDMQEAAKMTLINDAEKKVHNPVHTAAESSGTESHETLERIAVSPDDCDTNLEFAGACEVVQKDPEWAILDSNTSSSKQSQPIENEVPIVKTDNSQKIEEVHNPVHILEKCPELEAIITVWPNLPQHIKEAIKALINPHTGNKNETIKQK